MIQGERVLEYINKLKREQSGCLGETQQPPVIFLWRAKVRLFWEGDFNVDVVLCAW